MLKIDIRYNPYYMETKIKVNGKDIIKNSNYSRFKKYVNGKLPLQYWMHPIKQDDWRGFLEEIIADTGESSLNISFTGREIDFNDLKNELEERNSLRTDEDKLSITYESNLNISDIQVSNEIDKIIDKMLSEEFKSIIDQKKNQNLKKTYSQLEETYKRSKNKELNILFVGLYSSGKSTVINALLGETVLPTSDTTCTNKIYKIKHHKSNITLDGFNNKDKIIYHEVFDNLDNLGKRIFELPSSKNKLWSEISTVELQMDISHLYPDGFEDSFNLTIIDTPGTNSGEGNDEGQLKTHINITMDAIVEFEKNMVILVVDGQDYQDESIRSLLDQIDHANGLEKGIYNDRFLFVMNKCDNKNYQGDETLAKAISEYANYIKSDGRKNIKERMISPRIFPMAALPALAIRKSHINECCIDSVESQNLFYSYESFKKQCEGEFSLDNYHFEKHCILFSNNQEIIRSNNVIDETEDKNTLDILIHTGIPSLQFTIKEYIERYAYPLKIRDLLDTFEGILKEIKGLMKAEKVAYQAAMDRLKNEEDKKKSAREYKEQLVQQTDKAKVATKKLKELKTKLDQIKLDEHSFIEIKSQNNFLKSPKFQEILKMDSFETKREAESNIKIIVDEVNCRTNKMIDSFQKAQAEQNKKLSDIIKEVNDTINKLDNNNLLNIFNFNIKNSIVYSDYFKKLSFNQLVKNINKKCIQKKVENPIKKQKFKWYQFISKFVQFFSDDYIYSDTEVYSTAFLRGKINELTSNSHKLCDESEKNFKNQIEDAKNEIKQSIDRLCKEIEQKEKELKQLNNLINKYDLRKIQIQIDEIDKKINFLNHLTEKIEKILI